MSIVIIGQGGHSKVIADLIHFNGDHSIIGYFDDRYEDFMIEDNIFYGPVTTSIELLNFFDEVKFVIAIGDNKVRQKIVRKLGLSNDHYISLIHNSAIVSPSVRVGHGTVIMANTVIQADTEIGHHSIINTKSVIEHDNQIGDFVHVCPNATLTGTVHLEDGVQVGAGATVIPNIAIGEWAIIGAGASVINNIPANSTAVGIPAKVNSKMLEGEYK